MSLSSAALAAPAVIPKCRAAAFRPHTPGITSSSRSSSNGNSVVRGLSPIGWRSRLHQQQRVLAPTARRPAVVAMSMEGAGGPSSSSSMVGDGDVSPTMSRVLAVGSVSTAVALFLFARMAGAGPDLASLAAASMPYDQAFSNGRPTVVEFYADWCEVCKEMSRDVARIKDKYSDKVNFVMLNIDNPKWADELDEFGVDGIPHFVFLDSDGNEEGFVVGRMPRRILTENVDALASGSPTVPHSQIVGSFSEAPDAPVVEVASIGEREEVASPAQPAALTAAAAVTTSVAAGDVVDAVEVVPLTSSSAPAIETPVTTSPAAAPAPAAAVAAAQKQNVYSFEVENIKGERVSLEQYKGQVSLVVNVASKCGLTDSNYKGLVQLYDKLKDQGFTVLAFPSNQFASQEPGSNAQIESFACSRYKANFPLFAKIDVNGGSTAPLYRYLKSEAGGGSDVPWNFTKFLVDKEGNVVARYSPSFRPQDIEEDILALL